MLLYLALDPNSSHSQDLRRELCANWPDCIEYWDNTVDFKERLRKSTFDIDVLVIYLENDSFIEDLLEIKEILTEMEIILILSGTAIEKMHLLLGLYPRYISFNRQNFNDVLHFLGNKWISPNSS